MGDYKRESLYTAIVFYKDPATGSARPAKYRNVEADKPGSWKRFIYFIRRKFPTATAINLYGGITKEFYKQVKVEDLL
jgi:hypothetical protein